AAATKTVLIVLAHQSPGSFNAAVCDVAVQELRLQGFRVLLSDLYAMKFRADATRDDIIGELKKPELFQYGDETMSAWKEDRLSNDIVAEQRKVEEADLIIFQFPLYWFSVPAILKGWFDRVFTQGFAFSLENMYDNGVFKDKKAMLSFTTGAIQTMFQPDGINGDINVTLWPIQVGRYLSEHSQRVCVCVCVCVCVVSNLFCFLSEWHAALLWIPGSCSADILVPGPLGARRTHRHAGWVEGAAEGADGGEAPGVRPRRPLPPQLPGRLSDEAGGEEAARGRALRPHHGSPPGQAAPARQPAQSSVQGGRRWEVAPEPVLLMEKPSPLMKALCSIKLQ
ncbi:unnamed protein product, partial [Tetraodon nigroviridis]